MRLEDDIDFTTLSWVKQELDETLKQARQALEAFVEDATDTSQMRFCATYLHQVQGTLRMVELYGAALVVEEMEQVALELLEGDIADREEAYAMLMRGIVQLPDYLERLQSGHRDIPVVLLPLLNDLRAARGQKLLSETALFSPDLTIDLPADLPQSANLDDRQRRVAAAKIRKVFEATLVQWFRADGDFGLIERLQVLCRKLLQVTSDEDGRRLWWVADGILDGLRHKAITPNGALKLLIGKIDRQIKGLALHGETVFSTGDARELAQGLLYYAAHAERGSQRVEQLKEHYRLAALLPNAAELEHAQGAMAGHNRELLSTVSGAIKEDLMRVKDAFDLKVRRSDLSAGGLDEQVETLDRVADTLGMLGLGVPRKVVLEQRDKINDFVSGQVAVDESQLLDVAGSLLYVETSLDDHIDQLGAVAPATEAEGEDADPSTDLPRSEVRRILDALMKEASGNLQVIKQSIVEFIEAPWNHERIAETPALLEEIVGALKMLDMDEAAGLLSGVVAYTEVELLKRRNVPEAEELDTIADAVASLEYYLEAVREQRPGRNNILEVARQSLDRLGYLGEEQIEARRAEADAAAPAAEPEPEEAAPAAEAPAPAATDAAVEATPETPSPVTEPEADVEETVEPEAPVVAAEVPETESVEVAAQDIAVPAPEPAEPVEADISEDIDEEIREVFIEEVEEELAVLKELYPRWRADNEDADSLSTLRRTFHTLKGSGRLVGALTIGEFSWQIENLLNRIIDGTTEVSPQVIELMDSAVAAVPGLLANVKGEGRPTQDIEAIKSVAEKLAAGELVSLSDVAAPAAPAAEASAADAETPLEPAAEAEAPADAAEEEALSLLAEFEEELADEEPGGAEAETTADADTGDAEEEPLELLDELDLDPVTDLESLDPAEDNLSVFDDEAGVELSLEPLDDETGEAAPTTGKAVFDLGFDEDDELVPEAQDEAETPAVDDLSVDAQDAETDPVGDADPVAESAGEAAPAAEGDGALDLDFLDLDEPGAAADDARPPAADELDLEDLMAPAEETAEEGAEAPESAAAAGEEDSEMFDVDDLDLDELLTPDEDADKADDGDLVLNLDDLDLDLDAEPSPEPVGEEEDENSLSLLDFGDELSLEDEEPAAGALGAEAGGDDDAGLADFLDEVTAETSGDGLDTLEDIAPATEAPADDETAAPAEETDSGLELLDELALDEEPEATGAAPESEAEPEAAPREEPDTLELAIPDELAEEVTTSLAGEDGEPATLELDTAALGDELEVGSADEDTEATAEAESADEAPEEPKVDDGEIVEESLELEAADAPDLSLISTDDADHWTSESIDPVLKDILRSEVSGHLVVVRRYLKESKDSGAPQPVTEPLLRAVHTLNGAVSMVELPALASVASPLEGLVKRYHATGQAPDEDGMAVLADTADLLENVVGLLDQPVFEMPETATLSARLVALRDDLPESEALNSLAGLEEGDEPSDEALFSALKFEDEAPEATPAVGEQDDQEPAAEDLEPAEDETLDLAELEAEPETQAEAEPEAAPEAEHEVEAEAEALSAAEPAVEAATSADDTAEAEAADADARADEKAAQAIAELASDLEAWEESAETFDEVVVPEEDTVTLDSLGDVDEELLEIFLQEGAEILDESDHKMADWREQPESNEPVVELQRELHTLKGGARMAGLVPIGDLSHAMESLFEGVVEDRVSVTPRTIEILEAAFDRLHQMLDKVSAREALPTGRQSIMQIEAMLDGEAPPEPAPAEAPAAEPADEPAVEAKADAEPAEAEEPATEAAPDVKPQTPPSEIEQRPTALDQQQEQRGAPARPQQELIRVRADLLDNLVNYAGEVSIYRSRLEQQIGTFRFNLVEFDGTVNRLREQLRNLEIETEAQILSRYQREAEELNETFDPLELDRFSTLQQLSRALAESVSDLVSIQNMLDDLTRQSETLLLQQSRVNSDLQEGLMRTRMVPFDSLVPRLRRILRQTSSELDKKAQLKVQGAQGEMDRTVLERVTAPLEHMLRNAVAHGLEPPNQREKAGKDAEGTIVVNVSREATEVVITVADDGGGIDHERVRSKAIERGMLREDAELTDRDLYGFILETGFSTADEVTKVAGRGVGMDVVNSEIKQLGGSLDINSNPGLGTTFTIRLPFTLAVTHAIMVRVGDSTFAVPLTSIQGVVRMQRDEFDRRMDEGDTTYAYTGEEYQLKELSLLLGLERRDAADDDMVPVLMSRIGDQRAAIRVDAVLGSREIVVKSVGPQISSIPGIFGATILGDGSVIMILDLGPLVRRGAALQLTVDEDTTEAAAATLAERPPTIMVVDDSITMRKVTSRVLQRHEMEVVTAKDGVDAVEQLQDRIPDLMLLDIEMPRMDGFELATHMRNDERLRRVPIIMITSRTGDKHRDRALEIGVNRYLGKPYQEAELLSNVRELLAEIESES
ncbi:MAG: Hpt domain-containing protein [Pseudomonadota bacterium]